VVHIKKATSPVESAPKEKNTSEVSVVVSADTGPSLPRLLSRVHRVHLGSPHLYLILGGITRSTNLIEKSPNVHRAHKVVREGHPVVRPIGHSRETTLSLVYGLSRKRTDKQAD
jgi:hypothetical protein